MARLAGLSNDIYGEQGRNLIATMLGKSTFLAAIEASDAFQLEPTEFKFRTYMDSANLRTMAEGGAYDHNKTLDPTVTETNDKLAFYYDSFKVSTTRNIDAKKGLDNRDVWLSKTRTEIHNSFTKQITKAILTDDGTNNTMKGLFKRLDGTNRLKGFENTTKFPETDTWDYTRVVNAKEWAKNPTTATSLDVTIGGADYSGFFEMINNAIFLGDGLKYICVSEAFLPRFLTIARELKLTDYSYLFNQRVNTVAGLTVIPLRNDILTKTEPDDTKTTPKNETTSLYFLSPEENRLSLATNSGVFYYEFDHRENEQKDLEVMGINMNWKIEDPRSILRVRNIKF